MRSLAVVSRPRQSETKWIVTHYSRLRRSFSRAARSVDHTDPPVVQRVTIHLYVHSVTAAQSELNETRIWYTQTPTHPNIQSRRQSRDLLKFIYIGMYFVHLQVQYIRVLFLNNQYRVYCFTVPVTAFCEKCKSSKVFYWPASNT